MKKLLIFAAVCISMTAQATILRVSNLTNSGAPYSSISDAMSAAMDGDTIMVDGSSTSYGDITIDRKIVLMGPGYWLAENGVNTEGSAAATVGAVTLSDNAAGTTICGMWVSGQMTIDVPNVVVNRCHTYYIRIAAAATNCVFHQNFMYTTTTGQIISGKSDSEYAVNTQITNNIIIQENTGNFPTSPVVYLNEAYIANNTFAYFNMNNYGTKTGIASCTNCTIEKNVGGSLGNISGCTYVDNCTYDSWIYTTRTSDLTIKDQELDTTIAEEIAAKNAGAFNGDDPYVISGVPAGPMIQDITVPASVQQGSSLNVTIKLGIQR